MEELKTKTINCKICHKTFSMTPEQQRYYKDNALKDPKRCPHCLERRKKTYDYTCITCGAPFQLDGERKFLYEKKKLELPKHCPKCIAERKAKKQERLAKEAGDAEQ